MGRAFRIMDNLATGFRSMIDFLSLRDYDRADAISTDRIIKKQSRGSIFAQNGWYITRKVLEKKSREADGHIAKLRKAIAKAS